MSGGNDSSSDVVKTSGKHIMDFPAELRNRIWREVVRGDCTVINMHDKSRFRTENQPRLDFTITCEQIYEEAHCMYFAENVFFFRLNDNLYHYALIEDIANWLYTISKVERNALQRVVACTREPVDWVEFCWNLAVDIGMGSGFVVGGKLDKEIAGGNITVVHHWGYDHGHVCTGNHIEFIPVAIYEKREADKKAAAKAAREAAKMAKELARLQLL